jgi:peptidoglycan/xylan/chitin deacetylase (PgdA/CDA1 family)
MRSIVARAVRLRARWPLPIGPAAAVLGWHRIDVEGGRLAVRPSVFARQVEILNDHRQRFPVVHIDQVGTVFAASKPRVRCVVLTFDDAWADNHANALGPLSHHRLPAILYVPSRLLGGNGYMTHTQLLEVDAAGIAIGAHSRTHTDLRTCSPAELEREVRGSKEDLEDLIGKPVVSFAYPTGLHDDRVVDAVGAAGFTSAVTARPGWWRPATGLFRIPRGFAEDFSEATFLAAMQGGLDILRPIGAIKRLAPVPIGQS